MLGAMLAGVLMIMHRGNNWVADSHSLPWLQLQKKVLLYLYLVNGFFVAKRHHHHHQAFMSLTATTFQLHSYCTHHTYFATGTKARGFWTSHMEEEFPQSSLSEWLLMHTHVCVKNYSFCTTWSQMQRCQPRVHGGPWGVMSKLHCILSSVKTA